MVAWTTTRSPFADQHGSFVGLTPDQVEYVERTGFIFQNKPLATERSPEAVLPLIGNHGFRPALKNHGTAVVRHRINGDRADGDYHIGWCGEHQRGP